MSTVISEKLIINGVGSEVVLDGFDFTSNGYVEVNNASSVVIKNCRIYGIVPVAAKSFWLRVYNDIPVKLVVENCFFGSNPASGSNKVYNLFEPYAKLENGSSFSNNYFKVDCCTHNICNIYGCVNGAFVNVNGNHFELNNAVRIGVKGDVKCTINMRDNIIDANDPAGSPTYDGIACIQPYNKQTTSFANMNVVLSGNTLPEGQIIYAYSGSADTMMDETTIPEVIVNGKLIELPIYH